MTHEELIRELRNSKGWRSFRLTTPEKESRNGIS